jgi:3-deoxy-D-manno-octulosonate 8-phosphate phosphatase (KDO 8-P phosphatase)
VSGGRAVRGLVFDVDGVLTDGTVEISSSGHESKRFSIQDGTALLWCRLLGYELALVSGRKSDATAIRAAELGIDEVYQGVRDKAARVTLWAGSKGLALDEVLYMGDDHIDLPVFDAVGVSVAPANADSHVRARATHVTAARGGDGAVREAIEWLLTKTGRLDEALAAYRERVTGEARESAQ